MVREADEGDREIKRESIVGKSVQRTVPKNSQFAANKELWGKRNTGTRGNPDRMWLRDSSQSPCSCRLLYIVSQVCVHPDSRSLQAFSERHFWVKRPEPPQYNRKLSFLDVCVFLATKSADTSIVPWNSSNNSEFGLGYWWDASGTPVVIFNFFHLRHLYRILISPYAKPQHSGVKHQKKILVQKTYKRSRPPLVMALVKERYSFIFNHSFKIIPEHECWAYKSFSFLKWSLSPELEL